MPWSQRNTGTADKRRTHRRPVLYRLDITNSSDVLVGYLVDISGGGMRVRCVPGIEVSLVDELCIVLPRWMDMSKTLTMQGRFAWCRPFSDGRLEAGFVFGDHGDAQHATLESLIEKIAEAAIEDQDL